MATTDQILSGRKQDCKLLRENKCKAKAESVHRTPANPQASVNACSQRPQAIAWKSILIVHCHFSLGGG